MRENSRLQGILSYAGLSKDTLCAQAKQVFAQANFDVPERFSSFFPLFPFELIQNMDYVGVQTQTTARVAPSGFSIDPAEYHRKLFEQKPELYEGDNYHRNHDFDGRYHGQGVFTVDAAWAAHFPQYQPFMGEKLTIHLLGGGHQAIAVPQSLYPKGVGFLSGIERQMRVTQCAQRFVQYAKSRIEMGEAYHATAFGADYLEQAGLEPVVILQSELGRILQDVHVAKSLQQENPSAGFFTENAKRVEHIRQYVPFHYACDTFENASITRHTARLCQPCFDGMNYVSDLWIPYRDISGYVDKERMALDMARLCEGYQIAPAYDPETRGGRYPNELRVVTVCDRELAVLEGDVLNNPAHGGGINPQGMIGRQVFIRDSQERIRQGKLEMENIEMTVENTQLPPEGYRRALLLSALQETKGRLVDAMYRRESAISQGGAGNNEKAKNRLDQKVETLREKMTDQSIALSYPSVSGYDADIAYLGRKAQCREESVESELFEPDIWDGQREQSIESGYAMRNGIARKRYAELCAEQTPSEAAADAVAETIAEPQRAAREEPIVYEQLRMKYGKGKAKDYSLSREAEAFDENDLADLDVREAFPAESDSSFSAEIERDSQEEEAPGHADIDAKTGKTAAAKEARRRYTFGDIAPLPKKQEDRTALSLENLVPAKKDILTAQEKKGGKMAELVAKNQKTPQ